MPEPVVAGVSCGLTQLWKNLLAAYLMIHNNELILIINYDLTGFNERPNKQNHKNNKAIPKQNSLMFFLCVSVTYFN